MKFSINFMLLFIVLNTLASCKTIPKAKYDSIKLNVPHISQLDDYSCATTSLAMVMSYFDKKIQNKNEVWQVSGLSVSNVKNYGNDMNGLKKIADHYGYKSKFKEGLSLNDIENFLFDGTPIIINVLQREKTNTTHAVVVIGYDRNKRVLFINDPALSTIGNSISYERLKRIWSAYLKKTGENVYKLSYKSGFIIYPKD